MMGARWRTSSAIADARRLFLRLLVRGGLGREQALELLALLELAGEFDPLGKLAQIAAWRGVGSLVGRGAFGFAAVGIEGVVGMQFEPGALVTQGFQASLGAPGVLELKHDALRAVLRRIVPLERRPAPVVVHDPAQAPAVGAFGGALRIRFRRRFWLRVFHRLSNITLAPSSVASLNMAPFRGYAMRHGLAGLPRATRPAPSCRPGSCRRGPSGRPHRGRASAPRSPPRPRASLRRGTGRWREKGESPR